MIVAEKMIKSIPKDSYNIILKKIEKAEEIIKASSGLIRELPSGYWIRKVKNTDIFKFRLNNKDRVLFTFNLNSSIDERKNEIIFLEYVKHDKQIIKAKSKNLGKAIESSFEIDFEEYDFDKEIDTKLDIHTFEKYANNIIKIEDISAIEVNDQNLEMLFNASLEECIYYLSDEQYKPLINSQNAAIVYGGGGTGKTNMLINKMIWAKENNLKCGYITWSKLLVDKTKALFKSVCKDEETDNIINIMSLENLYIKCSLATSENLVDRYKAIHWIKQNKSRFRELSKIEAAEIWSEISGIIKGYLGLEFKFIEYNSEINFRKIDKNKYIENMPKEYVIYDIKERKAIYKLAEEYQSMLLEKDLKDENDLAYELLKTLDSKYFQKYDYLLIDEVQDLTEMQIFVISKLVKKYKNIMWIGDINQSINPTFFNFGRLKNLYYTYGEELTSFVLTKNYRSTIENTKLFNDIAKQRQLLIGKSSYDYKEKAVKHGDFPVVINKKNVQIKAVLEKIKDKHYCVVIVPDEIERDKLVELCKEASSRIFLVSEIKGLEYDKIFCYNIMSKYSQKWNDIFNGNEKKNEKMKYYFNLLYVAISRVKENLYIFEENKLIYNNVFFKDIQYQGKSFLKDLKLNKLSTKEEWVIEAKKLELAGQGEKAKIIRNLELESIIKVHNRIQGVIGVNPKNIDMNVEQKNDITKALTKGIKHYRQRAYDLAIDCFLKVQKDYPNEAEVYYYIANTYGYMNGGAEYSLQYYEKAIELDPNQYEYYIDYAAILKYIKKYRKCIRILDKAIEKFPNLGNAYATKATIYEDTQNFEKAIECHKEGIKRDSYDFDSESKLWRYKETKECKRKRIEGINRCMNHLKKML